jgi:CRISPR-associated protein Csm1
LLLENTVDELAKAAGVSRANVIYTSGDIAYLLFPNTQTARDALTTGVSNINRALLDTFGTRLFIASGMCEVNGDTLSGKNGPEAYADLFRNVSSQISRSKLSHWSAEDIRRLNAMDGGETGQECIICGTAMDGTEDGVCPKCSRLQGSPRDS